MKESFLKRFNEALNANDTKKIENMFEALQFLYNANNFSIDFNDNTESPLFLENIEKFATPYIDLLNNPHCFRLLLSFLHKNKQQISNINVILYSLAISNNLSTLKILLEEIPVDLTLPLNSRNFANYTSPLIAASSHYPVFRYLLPLCIVQAQDKDNDNQFEKVSDLINLVRKNLEDHQNKNNSGTIAKSLALLNCCQMVNQIFKQQKFKTILKYLLDLYESYEEALSFIGLYIQMLNKANNKNLNITQINFINTLLESVLVLIDQEENQANQKLMENKFAEYILKPLSQTYFEAQKEFPTDKNILRCKDLISRFKSGELDQINSATSEMPTPETTQQLSIKTLDKASLAVQYELAMILMEDYNDPNATIAIFTKLEQKNIPAITQQQFNIQMLPTNPSDAVKFQALFELGCLKARHKAQAEMSVELWKDALKIALHSKKVSKEMKDTIGFIITALTKLLSPIYPLEVREKASVLLCNYYLEINDTSSALEIAEIISNLLDFEKIKQKSLFKNYSVSQEKLSAKQINLYGYLARVLNVELSDLINKNHLKQVVSYIYHQNKSQENIILAGQLFLKYIEEINGKTDDVLSFIETHPNLNWVIPHLFK